MSPCGWCPDGVLELAHGDGTRQFHKLVCTTCGDVEFVPKGDPAAIRETLASLADTRALVRPDLRGGGS